MNDDRPECRVPTYITDRQVSDGHDQKVIQPDFYIGYESVHVDVAIRLQLTGELWCQCLMKAFWEISEGILQSKLQESRDYKPGA